MIQNELHITYCGIYHHTLTVLSPYLAKLDIFYLMLSPILNMNMQRFLILFSITADVLLM